MNAFSQTARSQRQPDICVIRGICEMILEPRDLHQLEQFYRRALGCPVLAREDDRVWLACGSHAHLGIWSPGPNEFGDKGDRHVHFALSAGPGELTALCERLNDQQVAYQGPIEHPGGDRSIYFED